MRLLNIVKITSPIALGMIVAVAPALVAQTQAPAPRNTSPTSAPAPTAPKNASPSSVQAPTAPAPRNISPASASAPTAAVPKPVAPAASPVAKGPLPSDYVIGVEDVLTVVFWREKDMSAEVVVRPDGKISLPMLNDVPAAGLTPAVLVKAITRRKNYHIGEVGKPGTFQLTTEMTVLKALGEAGGFIEGANKSDVVIVRTEGGTERRFKFNYNDVIKGKNLQQNIKLLPGDTIIVR